MSLFRMAYLFTLLATLGVLACGPGIATEQEPKDKEKGKEKTKVNRLAKESSPYLLQHSHNPVDWYAWGPEAFERAKKENKLVFLSIGYSSCHWCHVMERESFSNAEIAKTMNENFVCIKVDREERPDVDEIYMTALTVAGDHGGWPLTMFLTPTGKPIFGGTYFPPEDKKVGEDTMPGMKSILATVIELDKKKRDDLLKQADIIAEKTVDSLSRNSQVVALIKLERTLVNDVAEAFDIDPEYGGTGSKANKFRGTKFPRPPVWSFLLSQSKKPGKESLAKLVNLTLHNIAEGGIYDQLGGGFHRYSTERTWTVPHFEKMLYDNSQLVELYSLAYKLNADPLYQRVVAETVGFVKREMVNPEGGFYSALDADSNHKEGEFYVWTLEEIKAVLGNDADTAFLSRVYSVAAPNFEGKFHILRLPKPLIEIAKDQKLTEEQLLAKLEPLKAKLFSARAKRERPFLDTKVICAWNGQMIAGCARAGEVFKNKEYTQMAVTAANFLLTKMRGADGRLFRLWATVPGEKPAAKGVAFLDDYAYLIHGLLNLHDATGDKKWLDEAKTLTDLAITWYGDDKRGGFYYTPSDGEKLFARSKESYDGVQPSGNAQMARNLLRVWQKTKDDKYKDQCVKTIKVFALALRTGASSVPTLAQCLDELLDATGDDLASPKPAGEAPKAPKESADVVKAMVKLGEKTPKDDREFTLTLTVSPGWHIYANPVENDTLAESQTEVTVMSGKTALMAKVTYPKGKIVNDSDPMIGKYVIYEGTTTISGTVPEGKEDLEFRVKVNACTEKACLLQSVLKIKP
ncbi:MAG TPA: DUF255 domain-containing protein [Gemmata sp.]|nr:DUF255 domain-containing protein [Gemmata sp.]